MNSNPYLSGGFVTPVFRCLINACKGEGVRLFLEVPSKRMSGNRRKLQKEKFPHNKGDQTLEQAA